VTLARYNGKIVHDDVGLSSLSLGRGAPGTGERLRSQDA
jgi:hypothetical protein